MNMQMPIEEKFLNPPLISDQLFEKIKSEAETLYASITEIYCPFFKDKVSFNSQGLEHMKFKQWNKPRTRGDQYFRLKLFRLVPQIISESNTLQGKWDTKVFERRQSRGKWTKVLKEVTYYEFVAVKGNARIKLIVKQIGSGPKFFWSVIPFWKMTSLEGSDPRRQLHEGNPETD